jgi:DNA repair protein radc
MLEIREEIAARYEINGSDSLLNSDLIKMILTYVSKSKSPQVINNLTKKLLDKFNSLDDFVKADKETLKSFGINEEGALFINLIGDIGTRLYKEKVINNDYYTVNSLTNLVSYLRGEIGFSSTEEFIILFLDNRNKIVAKETLFSGTIDKSAIYPREIMKSILKYDAKSIIFAHNHPSNNVTPSKTDVDMTKEMYKNLKAFGVKLLDHVVITKSEYYSFFEEGII